MNTRLIFLLLSVVFVPKLALAQMSAAATQPASGVAISGSATIDETLSTSTAAEPLLPVFGSVFGADATSIVLRRDDGKYVTLTISGPVAITRTRAGTIADVKAGATVSSGSRPDAQGNLQTSEIIVRPAAAKGAGATSVPSLVWFKTPIAAVDQGTVQQVSSTATSSSLQLSQTTGTKAVAAPSTAKITVVDAATLADLARNVKVRALVAPFADGTLVASLVEIAAQ